MRLCAGYMRFNRHDEVVGNGQRETLFFNVIFEPLGFLDKIALPHAKNKDVLMALSHRIELTVAAESALKRG